MRSATTSRWFLAATAALMMPIVAAGCGSDDATITPEALQSALLTPADLEGEWSVEYAGPMTDEMREAGGGFDLCDEAAGIVAPVISEPGATWQDQLNATLASLDWQVTALTLPSGRDDAEPVSLTELLVTGDRTQIESVYTALAEGFRRCLAAPASDDAHGEAWELNLPEMGDERFGFVLSLGDEDGWDMRYVFVRDGDVLMLLVENEVLSGENLLSEEDVAAIAATGAAKLT